MYYCVLVFLSHHHIDGHIQTPEVGLLCNEFLLIWDSIVFYVSDVLFADGAQNGFPLVSVQRLFLMHIPFVCCSVCV